MAKSGKFRLELSVSKISSDSSTPSSLECVCLRTLPQIGWKKDVIFTSVMLSCACIRIMMEVWDLPHFFPLRWRLRTARLKSHEKFVCRILRSESVGFVRSELQQRTCLV